MTNAAGHPQTPRRAYLDTASGEPLHPVARQTLLAAIDRGYADPRRLHGPARDARLMLDNARAVVAECLGVRADEVGFTHSGTEAVHRGLLGLVRDRRRRVVHPAVEHSAVIHAAAWGSEPDVVAVSGDGRVRAVDLVEQAAGGDVAAVALQSANHEVGTVQPVDEVRLPDGVPLFVDACASMGRLPLPGGWSVVAGSAHKWGGPAGVGVLVVRKGARWVNPFPGEQQLDESATGFPNVPGALAAAAALQAVVSERGTENARQHALVDRVRHVVAALPDVEVVGSATERLPHLVTFSCLYVDGEALVSELDRHGFEVASGSACTSSALEPSHVLAAMGALTHGNVRLSVGRATDDGDVERFLAVLPGVLEDLRARL